MSSQSSSTTFNMKVNGVNVKFVINADVTGDNPPPPPPPPDHTCPQGQHWSDAEQKCIDDTVTPPPPPPPPPSGDFIPVLNADLKAQIQQPNKYKLLPNTEGKPPIPGFYRIGGKRRVCTGNYQSGSQGASDGIRANVIFPPDLINQEFTIVFRINEIRDTKGKDHYGTKCGSHADSGSALYTNSVEYFGDAGDDVKFQQETPHGSYRPMSCGIVDNKCPPIKAGMKAGDGNNPYPIKIDRVIAYKFIRWSVKDSAGNLKAIHFESWVDYNHGNPSPDPANWIKANPADWIKLGHCDEPFPAGCTAGGVGPVITPDGLTIPHNLVNGNVENTMRVNGGDVTWIAMSTTEIDAPPVPST